MDNDDGVSELCFDTLLSGFAALVFCSTKQWCEQLAESMARQVCLVFFFNVKQNVSRFSRFTAWWSPT